jgi:DNA-binding transcriptional LysR family regulator
MTELSVLGFRVIREIARQGSFTGAADRLGYTQSAVSRQVALLEQAAGQSLFERHARGVRSTEAGRVLLRHGEAVLAELDAAHDELENLGVDRITRVRIGGFSSALAALVPRALAALRVREPKMRMQLS